MWIFDMLGITSSRMTTFTVEYHANDMGTIFWAMYLEEARYKYSNLPRKLWKISDFQSGSHFVGYCAPRRMSTLVQAGLVERAGRDGKFQTFRITDHGMSMGKENEATRKFYITARA